MKFVCHSGFSSCPGLRGWLVWLTVTRARSDRMASAPDGEYAGRAAADERRDRERDLLGSRRLDETAGSQLRRYGEIRLDASLVDLVARIEYVPQAGRLERGALWSRGSHPVSESVMNFRASQTNSHRLLFGYGRIIVVVVVAAAWLAYAVGCC